MMVMPAGDAIPPSSGDQWMGLREESQASMRMLRRAIWNVRVAGPEDMADLGKKLYDINMKRFRIAGRQLPQPTVRCGQRGYMRRHGRGGEAY